MGPTTMTRWALHRCTTTQLWLRDRIDRLGDRLAARAAERDRGQTSFEYLGIAVVIAVIIGVLAGTTDIGDTVKNAITSTIDKITNGSGK